MTAAAEPAVTLVAGDSAQCYSLPRTNPVNPATNNVVKNRGAGRTRLIDNAVLEP